MLNITAEKSDQINWESISWVSPSDHFHHIDTSSWYYYIRKYQKCVCVCVCVWAKFVSHQRCWQKIIFLTAATITLIPSLLEVNVLLKIYSNIKSRLDPSCDKNQTGSDGSHKVRSLIKKPVHFIIPERARWRLPTCTIQRWDWVWDSSDLILLQQQQTNEWQPENQMPSSYGCCQRGERIKGRASNGWIAF